MSMSEDVNFPQSAAGTHGACSDSKTELRSGGSGDDLFGTGAADARRTRVPDAFGERLILARAGVGCASAPDPSTSSSGVAQALPAMPCPHVESFVKLRCVT